MNKERYQIPPDLTIGKYVGGWNWGELALIAGTAVVAIVIISNVGLSGMIAAAVPAAIAILCRRDASNSYTSPAQTLFVTVRWHLADVAGTMDFVLRQYLRMDSEEKNTAEKEADYEKAENT